MIANEDNLPVSLYFDKQAITRLQTSLGKSRHRKRDLILTGNARPSATANPPLLYFLCHIVKLTRIGGGLSNCSESKYTQLYRGRTGLRSPVPE